MTDFKVITERVQGVRESVADSVEEIGQVLGLLREGLDAMYDENIEGGKLCVEDAAELLSQLERDFSARAAELAKLMMAGADQEIGGPRRKTMKTEGMRDE